MTNRTTCDIWLYIDLDGEYGIGSTDEEAQDHYRNNIGDPEGPMSLVHLSADVPLPRTTECRLVLPEQPQEPVSVSVEPY